MCLVLAVGGFPQPTLTWAFGGWVVVAALSQMAGTALLLRAMEERSFAIGLVYSKSEVIQVALFSVLFLGETLSALAIAAIVVATLGVVLLSPRPPGARGREAKLGRSGRLLRPRFRVRLLPSRSWAIAAPTLRFTPPRPFWPRRRRCSGASSCRRCCSVSGCCVRNPAVVLGVLRQWRVSMFAGVAGASASLANVTALALAPASQVRTLILIEVVFSYFVSRRVFRETMNRRELAGIVLVDGGRRPDRLQRALI